MYKILLLASVFFVSNIAGSKIHLNNPSFEDTPQDATTPRGWDACGKYSTPDILPGFWGVETSPADGKSFIGLIVRDDNTWEYLGQTLSEPLRPKTCYKFDISLAKAIGYSGYGKPARIRIWGSPTKCGKGELLGQTTAVNHTDWKTYNFVFTPKTTIKYMTIEAHYVGNKAYKGNVLLDNCSDIEICLRASL